MLLFRNFTVAEIVITNTDDESTFDKVFSTKNYDPYQHDLPFPLWIFAILFKHQNSYYVVQGEILPAYVQKVRDDGKLDIGLRAFGGKQKSLEVSEQILEQLKDSPDGILEVGDKSTPEDINRLFPGVSKTVRSWFCTAGYGGSIPKSTAILSRYGEMH